METERTKHKRVNVFLPRVQHIQDVFLYCFTLKTWMTRRPFGAAANAAVRNPKLNPNPNPNPFRPIEEKPIDTSPVPSEQLCLTKRKPRHHHLPPLSPPSPNEEGKP